MECGRFIMTGEDTKTLISIKNMLTVHGHIFLGYLKNPNELLRHTRSTHADFVIIDEGSAFSEILHMLQVIEEDFLAACVFVLNSRKDEVTGFIEKSKGASYIVKPAYEDAVIQIVNNSLLSFRRIQEYETKVRKLNNILDSRKVIEKAKWILVSQDGLSEAEAYEAIKKKSRDNRVPMSDIANALILTRG